MAPSTPPPHWGPVLGTGSGPANGYGPASTPGPASTSGPVWGAAAPAPMSGRNKRLVLGGLGGLVALLLVAGIAFVAVQGSSGDDGPSAEQLRAPFLEAANSLGAAPGIDYDDGTYQVKLSRYGDFTGTFEARFTRYPIIRTDGVTYAQLDAATVSRLLPYASTTTGKSWVRLGDVAYAGLFVDARVPDSPEALSRRILAGLNGADADFTPPTDSAAPSTAEPSSGASNTSVTFEGTPALMAMTGAGAVYVTEASPHKLLHLPVELLTGESGQEAGPDTAGSARTGQTDVVSFSRPRTSGGPAVAAFAGVNLAELSTGQVGDAYDELLDRGRALTEVLDGEAGLALGRPKVKCTLSTCSYQVKVTADAASRVALTATFEVDGKKGVGGCSAVVTFTTSQARTVGCSTKSAAPEMKAAMADARADALVRSRALGGARVSYSVPYYGEGRVRGVVPVGVKKLASTLRERRSEFGPAPGGSEAR
ncbi:hypothetical protein [Kineosporia mesophila]|uniref:hypothetical protein n=1 Tax=Kineosporia mesophila TaxID=566012 RepID=UPI001E2CDE55|nr:hypothetical protein [Kineosporia mesophila]MCD5354985.1 hypothetical protein [Kineosporia mesophila]